MRRAEPQTEGELLRQELGAGVTHLRRALGLAGSQVGPRMRAMRDRWRSVDRLADAPVAEQRRWTLPLGLVAVGAVVGAATAIALVRRRQRRRWEEYDAELALEEAINSPADRQTGMVPDEERAQKPDQMST